MVSSRWGEEQARQETNLVAALSGIQHPALTNAPWELITDRLFYSPAIFLNSSSPVRPLPRVAP